jgi:hypothetical protein
LLNRIIADLRAQAFGFDNLHRTTARLHHLREYLFAYRCRNFAAFHELD